MPAISKQEFVDYLARARVAAAVHGDEYWFGYIRGLRRLQEGTQFSTDGEHALWMLLAEMPESAALGRGYRDGFAGIEPKPQPASIANIRQSGGE